MTITSAPYARIDDVARFGDAAALVVADRVITHAQLDRMVAKRATEIGTRRRLLVLEAANELEPVVTYLAALRGHHPVLLTPPALNGAPARHWEKILAHYRPDAGFGRDRDGSWELELDSKGGSHDLHPDLAVLLGTSGSTGTPKLVRLSRRNLVANAGAIADYLGLDGSSRAATTLPLQYCYGLSVLNSHLLVGGSVWLTGASVIDEGFFDDFARAGATSLAGVPYTYELLERTGGDWLATPGLRQITQAGGRLDPTMGRDIAVRAQEHGVELVIMYGQTEATARMAYLPPPLAASRPETIGIPIPGGEFRIDDGELVYRGPNVMMGYADSLDDLARGHVLSELRTGDLAVQHDDGLYEIVGRRNRLAKLFGTRLDLDLAERLLADHGVDARATAREGRLRIHVVDRARSADVAGLVASAHGLPAHAAVVDLVDTFPTTASGKTDYAALTARRVRSHAYPTVTDAFTGVFGPHVRETDSFTSLGGDSLSYVELYVRLEPILGTLPEDWPRRSIAELSRRRPVPVRRWASVETPILLRALAIVLIVGSHVDLWDIKGGAHVLLVAFGYNLSRFVLHRDTVRERIHAVRRAVAEMMTPVLIWGAGVVVLSGDYAWPAPLALNNLLGPEHFTPDWWLWFFESALWSAVAITALLSVPFLHRLHASRPFAMAMGITVAGLLLRGVLADSADVTTRFYSIPAGFWCVALGLAVAGARTRTGRIIASVVAVTAVWGWFDTTHRDLVVLAGILGLTWLPRVRLPRAAVPLVSTLAASSLFVYLTHWQVYPILEEAGHPVLALLASFALGTSLWAVYTPLRRRVTRVRRPRPGRLRDLLLTLHPVAKRACRPAAPEHQLTSPNQPTHAIR